MCTWFDYAYVVHPYLKIHTGGCMSFKYGMVHSKSSNKKLNRKSSTKAGVVGVSDYLTYNIWICLFMVAQEYNIKQNILFQDNQSAIKMEKTGRSRALVTPGKLIYVTSLLSKRLKVTKCLLHTVAQNICSQIFTKALHGALFAKFCDAIMGC